ncbi:DUF3667 domain-containing protein [Nevskia sp.]|uniref:DUF3667 domain-containing protein n=1 Tax=Nevskia sp. TaxID=1929292 RepID=UPI003F705D57
MHATRPPLQPAPVDGPFCRNCGARAEVSYCPVCGQETRIEMPTVGHFIAEFAEQTFALQGQLWRTLQSLLLKPGELTLEYVAGRRQRYVRPLRLYLALSILFFAVLGLSGNTGFMQIGSGPEAQVGSSSATADRPAAAADGAGSSTTTGGEEAGATARRRGEMHIDTGFPDFDARANHRLDLLLSLPKEELTERIFDTFTSWAPAAMFLLMPLFAAFLKLGYLRRGANYAVHLLFAVNFHSFIFLVLLAGLLPVIGRFDGVLALAVPAYLWLALRRVHGGGWLSTALFVLLLCLVYVIAMALVMALAILLPLALL